jgi:hypothetical protein
MNFKDHFSRQAADYSIFRPATRSSYSTISAALRRVISSRGTAVRETDKPLSGWHRYSIV